MVASVKFDILHISNTGHRHQLTLVTVVVVGGNFLITERHHAIKLMLNLRTCQVKLKCQICACSLAQGAHCLHQLVPVQ